MILCGIIIFQPVYDFEIIGISLYTGCLTNQLTHITWHNFVNFNAFVILFQI